MENENEIIQKIKVTEALAQYTKNPSYENHSKFLLEFAKLGIEHSYNSEREKEMAKDWADLGYELFISKDYRKAESLTGKLGLSINRAK